MMLNLFTFFTILVHSIITVILKNRAKYRIWFLTVNGHAKEIINHLGKKNSQIEFGLTIDTRILLYRGQFTRINNYFLFLI